jgi:hypothetical protein
MMHQGGYGNIPLAENSLGYGKSHPYEKVILTFKMGNPQPSSKCIKYIRVQFTD